VQCILMAVLQLLQLNVPNLLLVMMLVLMQAEQ
jgi:hypothetical protein